MAVNDTNETPEQSSLLASVLQAVPVATWILLAWALGVVVMLASLVLGTIGIRRVARKSRHITDPSILSMKDRLCEELAISQPVLMLQSDESFVPVTWGVWWPTVLLPREANDWSRERLRMVLLHELAHIKRGDCLTQVLVQLARAMYWFHPLVWWAARNLRIQRERACDDLVLEAGVAGPDYADQLLQIVRSYRSGRGTPLAAVAMARKSQFESRLLSVLDTARKRGGLTRKVAWAILVVALAVAVPVAALQPVSRADSSKSQSQKLPAFVPSTSHLDENGRIVDKIGYPFQNDPAVLGRWESVDFVKNIKDFDPNTRAFKGDLYLKEMTFRKNGKTHKRFWIWTKGLLFHSGDKTASRYTIQQFNGTPYMFLEWKSGDYVIRHQKPKYYVLRKVAGDSAEENNEAQKQTEKKVPELSLQAKTLREEKKYLAALNVLEQIIEIDPKNTWALDNIYMLRKFITMQARQTLTPIVVRTTPTAFADDVDPKLDKITVTFDKPMMDGSWSWTGGGETYPKVTGKIHYDDLKRTCTLPVKLQPGKVYWVGINSPSHKNFKTPARKPARWYAILFATKSADGKPTPIPQKMLRRAKQINSVSRSPSKPLAGLAIPTSVLYHVVGAYLPIAMPYWHRGQHANAQMYLVTDQNRLVFGALVPAYNHTNKPLKTKQCLTTSSYNDLLVFNTQNPEGARPECSWVETKRPTGSGGRYALMWTPKHPLYPGDSKLFLMQRPTAQPLPKKNGELQLYMQNKLGAHGVEQFFLVVPAGRKVSNVSRKWTSKTAVKGYDIYCFQTEVTPSTNNVVTADVSTLLPEGEKRPIPTVREPLATNRKGLILYYSFDKNEGTKVTDLSGRGDHGEVCGATWTPHGKVGGAYEFDGRAYIGLPHKRFLDGCTDVTICAWFNCRLPRGRGGQILASGDMRGGKDPITTRITTKQYGDFGLLNMVKDKDFKSFGRIAGVRPGSWQMITITLKSGPKNSSYRVYLDGNLIDKQESPGRFSISYDRNMPTQIGAIHGTQGWVGLIDEFMVFDRALSEKEIKQLYLTFQGQRDTEKHRDNVQQASTKAATKTAVKVAKRWLKLIEAGDFGKSWDEIAKSAKESKPSATREQWIKDLTPLMKKLGAVQSRKLVSKDYTTTVPGAADGQYVILTYKTVFKNKKGATETVSTMKDKDGRWRVAGYWVK